MEHETNMSKGSRRGDANPAQRPLPSGKQSTHSATRRAFLSIVSPNLTQFSASRQSLDFLIILEHSRHLFLIYL